MTTRVEKIRQRLEERLQPDQLEIIDDSLSHAGHAGAMASGGGHFSATIVSRAFEGKTLVQRHQLVYQALGELLQSDIHAFSLKAFTPLEYQNKGNHS
jgi:BolA protein